MNARKRFTIRTRLLLYFCFLSTISICGLSFIAVFQARKSLTVRIQSNLHTIAEDQAKLFEERYITSPKSNLETLAACPTISDPEVPPDVKMAFLAQELKRNQALGWHRVMYAAENGIRWYTDGSMKKDSKEKKWFKLIKEDGMYLSSPHLSPDETRIEYRMAIPVHGVHGGTIGIIAVEYDALQMSKDSEKIKLGRGGKLYLLDKNGITIVAPNIEEVKQSIKNKKSTAELAKENAALENLATFEERALAAQSTGIGFYKYNGTTKTAVYTKVAQTDWTLIVHAEAKEFMGSIYQLIQILGITASAIILLVIGVTIILSHRLSRPLVSTAEALKNIAEGEGDLTVSLPMRGNDEISDISLFFNKTIQKLRKSIGSVGKHSVIMEELGHSLAVSMMKTALSIDEIRASIEGVKAQAIEQKTSVSETTGTVNRIIGNLETLNGNIENQAASVMRSSASIEQMVANIDSITQSLEKSNTLAKTLAEATAEGKQTLLNSNTVTQKIIEQSGGLLEASNIIQNIAEQTNLLAMNAAIEAAHAGESGKGFAVVADEIRKLAEESSAQGKSITETLRHLSDEIAVLSSSTQIVEEKFNAIFQLAENVRGMSSELTAAMSEQENGSREVLAAIKNINSVTVEVKNGSAEMLIGGKGVVTEMQKLDSLTTVIKDSMNEMSDGVSQINNAVHEVNALAVKNKESVEGLARVVRKFKV